MQAGAPSLPPNLTQQQVQEVFQVRLLMVQITQLNLRIAYFEDPTNNTSEIPAHESGKSP